MKIRTLVILTISVFASFSQAAPKFTYESKNYNVKLFDEYAQQTIVFNGYILPLDTDKGLRDVVKFLIPGKNTTLAIGVSNGGETRVFKKFGRALQKICPAGSNCVLTTYVKDKCISACTFLYLYGRERVATPGALFGFHREYVGALGVRIMTMSKTDLMEEYIQRGVNAEWAMANAKSLTSNQKNCVFANALQLMDGNYVLRVDPYFYVPELALLAYPETRTIPSGGTAFVPASGM